MKPDRYWDESIRPGDRFRRRNLVGESYGPVRTVERVEATISTLHVIFEEDGKSPRGFFAPHPLFGWAREDS